MQHLFGMAVLGTLSRGQRSLGTCEQPEKLWGCSCFLPTGWEPAAQFPEIFGRRTSPPALPHTRGHQNQERSPVTWSAGPQNMDLSPSEESLLLHSQLPLEMCVIPKVFAPCRQGKGCSTYHGEGFPGLLE